MGTIMKHKSGWRVYWTIDGVRRSKVVNGSREDAEAFLVAMNLGRQRADMKFRDYWVQVVEPSTRGLQAHTTTEYKRLWARLETIIGERMISTFTWRDAQATLDKFDKPSEQRHALAVLRKICNMALNDDLLQKNPTKGMKLAPKRKKPKAIPRPWELMAIMDKIQGQPFEPLFLLEVGCGLRHEEACAMVWENIIEYGDLASYTVKVERALTEVNGVKILKETKTEASDREVFIAEPFYSRLRAIRSRSGAVFPYIRIFPDRYCAGDFQAPSKASKLWRKFCRDNDIEYFTFGQMRSVYVTLCAEAGCPDSLVSLSLGHTDGTTRGNNYQVATAPALHKVAERYGQYISANGIDPFADWLGAV